jgi:TonB family protein
MTRGKQTCKILKEIRQQIAEKNDIEYITSECNFKGECKGTCPKCEEELRFLENELKKRKQLGNAAIVAGVSLGIAGTFAACTSTMPVYWQELTVERTKQNTTTDTICELEMLVGDIEITEGDIVVEGYIAPPFEEIEIDYDQLFQTVEDAPQFPGGNEARMKFLQQNVRYPAIMGEMLPQGTVFVRFIIEKDGSITDIKILRGISSQIDEEAIRVVESMPKWIPGKMRGQEVRVEFLMPIRFTLAG